MTSFKDASRYVFCGSASAFLIYICMAIYGDYRVSDVLVLATGIYFVMVSGVLLGLSYLRGERE
jgi:hypothetical protein